MRFFFICLAYLVEKYASKPLMFMYIFLHLIFEISALKGHRYCNGLC